MTIANTYMMVNVWIVALRVTMKIANLLLKHVTVAILIVKLVTDPLLTNVLVAKTEVL